MAHLRLLFDARYIRTDFHDGISRFSAELARAVAEQASHAGVDVAFIIHDDEQKRLLPADVRTVLIHAPTSWLEPFTSLRLNRYAPDAVFSPMQTIGSFGRRFKLIVSLHDTIYYRHRRPPGDLPALVRLGWRLFHLSYAPQRLVLNSADTVATVSETTKKQFARARLTKRPVIVLPNAPQRLGELRAADDVVSAGGSGTERLADQTAAPRNLVYMGSFMPYKNVETLIRAIAHLPEHTLHLMSRIGDARRAELEAVAAAAGVGPGSIVFHNGVTDEEYATALDDRAVLVTLSLDEGYGLPIAEALGFGVPAVVSDLEIFHEVGGEGALFVPPHDAAAAAAAIRSLDDDALRARVIAAGRTHAAGFSWQLSAERLFEAVHRLVRGRSVRE